MTVSREAEKLASDLKAVVHDGENLLRTAGHELNAKARERFSETLATAKETCRQAEETCRQLAKRTNATVREHPYYSLGVALGVGVVLAALFLRRH